MIAYEHTKAQAELYFMQNTAYRTDGLRWARNEIESLREQLAAALAAIKVKDEAMQGALYSGSPYTTAFENALAIKPIDIDGLKMSNEFKREPRYVVFKIKDIHAYLPPHLVEAIKAAGETITVGRALEKRPLLMLWSLNRIGRSLKWFGRLSKRVLVSRNEHMF